VASGAAVGPDRAAAAAELPRRPANGASDLGKRRWITRLQAYKCGTTFRASDSSLEIGAIAAMSSSVLCWWA